MLSGLNGRRRGIDQGFVTFVYNPQLKLASLNPIPLSDHAEADNIAAPGATWYRTVGSRVEEIGLALDDYSNETLFGRYLSLFQSVDRIDEGFEQRQEPSGFWQGGVRKRPRRFVSMFMVATNS